MAWPGARNPTTPSRSPPLGNATPSPSRPPSPRFQASVRGSWTGNQGQRIAGLIFIAPKTGVYHITANAFTKPWTGNAKIFPLAILKKDTQRATQEKLLELPRDATKVPLDFKVELTAGHELVFLPLMPDWHNATNTTTEDLAIAVDAPEPESKK